MKTMKRRNYYNDHKDLKQNTMNAMKPWGGGGGSNTQALDPEWRYNFNTQISIH